MPLLYIPMLQCPMDYSFCIHGYYDLWIGNYFLALLLRPVDYSFCIHCYYTQYSIIYNSFYGMTCITYFSYVQQKSWFPSFNNGPTSVSFWLHFSSFQLTFTEIHNSLLGTRQVDWLTRPTYNTTNKVHRLDTPISQLKAAQLLLVVKTTGIQSQ